MNKLENFKREQLQEFDEQFKDYYDGGNTHFPDIPELKTFVAQALDAQLDLLKSLRPPTRNQPDNIQYQLGWNARGQAEEEAWTK